MFCFFSDNVLRVSLKQFYKGALCWGWRSVMEHTWPLVCDWLEGSKESILFYQTFYQPLFFISHNRSIYSFIELLPNHSWQHYSSQCTSYPKSRINVEKVQDKQHVGCLLYPVITVFFCLFLLTFRNRHSTLTDHVNILVKSVACPKYQIR